MTIQHGVITDPDVHEPKGASTASVGQVYVSDGAGSGTWDMNYPLTALVVEMDITDVADFYVVAPFACVIEKMYSVISGAIGGADKTFTLSIDGTPVTSGAITVAYSESAAGDVESCTPSANNTASAGEAIKIAAAGASTGTVSARLTLVIRQQ